MLNIFRRSPKGQHPVLAIESAESASGLGTTGAFIAGATNVSCGDFKAERVERIRVKSEGSYDLLCAIIDGISVGKVTVSASGVTVGTIGSGNQPPEKKQATDATPACPYPPAKPRRRPNDNTVYSNGTNGGCCIISGGSMISCGDGDSIISVGRRGRTFINGVEVGASSRPTKDTGLFVEKPFTLEGLENVSSIVQKGFTNVVFTQGESPRVSICADSSIIELFTATVGAKGLSLGIKPSSFSTKFCPYFLVTLPVKSDLSVDILGSGDFEAETLALTGEASFGVAGSSDINIGELRAAALSVGISGSGDFDLGAGFVNRANISVSGSGDFDGGDCEFRDADFVVSGSGDIEAHVTGSVAASVSGSGEIDITGNPKVKRERMSGSGEILIR